MISDDMTIKLCVAVLQHFMLYCFDEASNKEARELSNMLGLSEFRMFDWAIYLREGNVFVRPQTCLANPARQSSIGWQSQ